MTTQVSVRGRTKQRTGVTTRQGLNALLFLVTTFLICLLILVARLPILTNVLYSPQTAYAFGTVEAGTMVHHAFAVRNLHPWSVKVTGARGSCGCTKTFVGKEIPFVLHPLEVVWVNVQVDTALKQGAFSQPVTILTNDSPVGTVLTMRGTVVNSPTKKGNQP